MDSITRLHAGPRMSQAVVHGSTIYLAGQVADQAKGKSVSEQTKEILATIDRLLAEAGSDKTKILLDHHLSRRHRHVCRNERGVGRMGRSRPCACPRDRRGEARPAGLHRRDRLHRGQGLMEAASAPIPSLDSDRGPFERVTTPDEAIDRLARLYDEATQALRGAVERFLKNGEPPSAATRALFRYPELRLTYAPGGAGAAEPARLREIQRGWRLHDHGHPAGRVSRLSQRAARAAGQRIRRDDRGRRRRAGDPLSLRDRERRRADARRRRRGRARAVFPGPLARHDRRRNRRRRIRVRPRAAACPVRRAARRLFAAPPGALYRLRLAGDAALGAAHQLPPLRRPVRPLGP